MEKMARNKDITLIISCDSLSVFRTLKNTPSGSVMWLCGGSVNGNSVR